MYELPRLIFSRLYAPNVGSIYDMLRYGGA